MTKTQMTAPYRKKLIEVALPLNAINEASAREKEPFTRNHPRSMHIWWARRPLVACRAVLFASLVDDPDSDPAYRKPDGTVDEERAGKKRAELFNLIEELVRWENSNNPRVINQARAEIARCVASRKIELRELKKDNIIFGDKKGQKHPKGPTAGEATTAWAIVLMQARPEIVNAFLAEYAPPVLDPFCGGGSIPLEAQRLGLRAYASDLNPVPVLVTKSLIEIPSKFACHPPVNPEWQSKSEGHKAATIWQGAQGLAEDVRFYGQWMRDEAEKRLGHLYPKVKITKELAKARQDLTDYIGQELRIVAWLWARTIQCPNPACGARAPLVRSFWVSTKKGKAFYAEPLLDRTRLTVRFHIRSDGEPPKHTTDRNGGRCLFCDRFIKKPELRDISVAHGLQHVPLAIVAEGNRSRVYLDGDVLPPVDIAKPPVQFIELPMTNDRRWFSPPLYGMPNFADLFTPRQLVALTTFSDLVLEARAKALADAKQTGLPTDDRPLHAHGTGPRAYADGVGTYLALGLSRWTDLSNTICSWNTTNQNIRALFARQAIPMSWDFAELNPLSSLASPGSMLNATAEFLDSMPFDVEGHTKQLDATAAINGVEHPVVSTDPPYYDNIGYADLSDFFYVWLRRTLKGVYPSLFATALTPKAQELIASPYRHEGDKLKAQEFFETGLGQAFTRMHEAHAGNYPLTVYYAFKQSETQEDAGDDDSPENPQTASTGWETMLAGLIRSGFAITGTWPMRTERTARSVSLGTNALASSIVLVCRARPADARLATRKEFINALRQELPEALKNLQQGNIAPVDMAQSAIGPGMSVFTRFGKVIESDGSPMSVRTALGIINQVLDEVLAEQEGDFDADTRWALAWFEQFGTAEGPYGVAETLSKAKNTAVNGLVKARIVKAPGGKVQLIGRDALPDDWDPTTDKRLTVWEITQHLIRTLEKKGEGEAAALLDRLGGMAETARELAYRLYSICERKKWAAEALAYNSLVIAWPELSKLAVSNRNRQSATQQELFQP
jgi:putative DNA methylase